MHLLVTRPEAEAAAFRAQLEALGHVVTIEPLLLIDTFPIARDALRGTAGIIATSRNGLRALADSPAIGAARGLPLVAVGPGTAQLGRDLGFAEVITGPGTGAELVPLVVEMAGTIGGPLTHVRGEEVAFDLRAALSGRGIELRELVAYRSVPADALGQNTQKLLTDGKVDGVILMSPRTAGIFARLIGVAGLEKATCNLVLLCLSKAVAAAAEPIGSARVEVADTPDMEGMLSAVTRVATLWSGV